MYGREKIAVVNPTNAVSATRKTLNESTKNCRPSTSCGPSTITRAVSATAAANVRKLTATLTVGAARRSPMTARSAAPASGKPRTARISITYHSPSFSFSRCLRSRLSNCSRIWKKNTPRISMPTRTSSAMPSSTTIGMP